MQFALIAHDHEDALERRLAARAEHMAGVKRGKEEGWIIDGGALLDEEGNMAGSAMLLDFPDRAALDAYLAQEVYARSNVWDSITVLPMRRVDWTSLAGG